VAVLALAAFGRRQPRAFENWHCIASRGWFERTVHVFPRSAFLVDGVLPAPAAGSG
jgi:hypothetical protein